MSEERETTAPLEVEDLRAGWAAKTAARPRYVATVRFGAKTDLGLVRENNEDKFDFIEPDEPSVLATHGRVYAVADGMGGHDAGQIASELALKTFIRAYYMQPADDIQAAATLAIRQSNAFVVDVARTIQSRSGMGTTLTVAIVRDEYLYAVQVGDSRLYQIRGGMIRQVTDDHSWVAEQVKAGILSEAEAEQSPYRNVITRSLGGGPDVEPDFFAVDLQPGDRYVLCSDGLSGMVSDATILQVASARSPSVACWELIDLANEQGGRDNITVMVLEITGIEPGGGAGHAATRSASPPAGLPEPPMFNSPPTDPISAPPQASDPPPPDPQFTPEESGKKGWWPFGNRNA